MDGRDDALAPSNEVEADGSSIVVRVVGLVVCSALVRLNARAALLRVFFSMMTMTFGWWNGEGVFSTIFWRRAPASVLLTEATAVGRATRLA